MTSSCKWLCACPLPWTQGLSDLFNQVAPRPGSDASYAWASAEVQARPMGPGFRAFTEALRGVLVQLGEGSDAEHFAQVYAYSR